MLISNYSSHSSSQDTLDPALRVSTERRLASLQQDLAIAQSRTTEKEFGKKYHMVKFFGECRLVNMLMFGPTVRPPRTFKLAARGRTVSDICEFCLPSLTSNHYLYRPQETPPYHSSRSTSTRRTLLVLLISSRPRDGAMAS